MKTNIGNISIITLGLIAVGALIATAFGYWTWRATSYFSHGMFPSHSFMSYGTSSWGIILAIGAALMIGIVAISMIKNSVEQNNRDLKLCPKCGEELTNADLESCPVCGELIEVEA